MLVLADQHCETQKYSICCNVRQRKAANPHITETESIIFLPFVLKKVIILALKVVMLGWMCVICVITDVQINFNETSFSL